MALMHEMEPAESPIPITDVPAESGFTTPVDYLKLGNKIFAVREIAEVDIHKEVREYYKNLYENQVTRWKTAISAGHEGEWSRQMDRISSIRDSFKITIPEELQGIPVQYIEQTRSVGRCVPIIYHPWKVVGSKASFGSRGINLRTSVWEPFALGDQMEVLIKSDLFFPCSLTFIKETRDIFMIGLYGFHSMSGAELCYGNRNYVGWESLSPMELSKQASIINLDSLGRTTIKFEEQEIPLAAILTDAAITSVKKEEVTSWRIQ